MNNLISICIPTYRRPSQLLHALHSCLIQDYRPLEILIGDDSPHPDSEDLVKTLPAVDDIAINYVRNVPSLGQSGNVNSLFARAHGQRIVLLHDDDVLEPGAVQALQTHFDSGGDITAVYGLQQIISESGELDQLATDAVNLRYKRSREFVGAQQNPILCAFWRQFPNDGYLVDAVVARTIGYRPFLEVGESCDTDFALRLALYSRGKTFYLIDKPIVRYRRNREGLSGSRDISWRFYDQLLALTNHLSPVEIEARDKLLTEISVQALIENSVHRRRRSALRILFSRYYPLRRRLGFLKFAFHVVLIAFPQIDKLKQRSRKALS